MEDRIINLNENASLLKDHLKLVFEFSALDQSLADVVQAGGVLDRTKPLPLAELGVEVAPGAAVKTLSFKDAVDVKFGFSADAEASLGILFEAKDVRKELRIDDSIEVAEDFTAELNLDEGVPGTYLVLGTSYGVEGSVSANMPLGTIGAATLGVSGDSDGSYVVIRKFSETAKLPEVLQGIADSFVLPKHATYVNTHFKLSTWLVTTVRGGLNVDFGVKMGYDYNWVRENASLGKLQGDLGLRLSLGLQAKLGLTVGGDFVVMVSRPSVDSNNQVVRLQYFKQTTRGTNFGFSAGFDLTADIDDSFTPDNLTGLIEGVLGLSGAQLTKAMELISSDKALKKFLTDEVTEKLVALAVDLEGSAAGQTLTEVRKKLVSALKYYNDIDSKVSSIIWDKIGSKEAIHQVREIASEIATFTDEKAIELIESKIGAPKFFDSAAGEFLSGLLEDKLDDLIADSSGFKEVKDLAKQVNNLLTEATLTKRLADLKQVFEEELGLEKLKLGDWERTLSETEISDIPELMQERIKTFIGTSVDQLKATQINAVRQTIAGFYKKANDLYAKTVKAMRETQTFHLSYAVSKATTKDALIDVEFNMSDPVAQAAYHEVLSGELGMLFNPTAESIKVRKGVLTHQIDRTRSVSMTLPWMKYTEDSITQSIAQFEFGEEDGKIYGYSLAATNSVFTRLSERNRGLNMRANIASVNMALPVDDHSLSAIIEHGGNLEKSGYVMVARQGVERTTVASLHRILNPIIGEYLKDYFAVNDTGASNLKEWLMHLESELEASQGNGPLNFGASLYKLQVDLPAALNAVWITAPEDRYDTDGRYHSMARGIQKAYRAAVFEHYFGSSMHSDLMSYNSAAFIFSALPDIDYKCFQTKDGPGYFFKFYGRKSAQDDAASDLLRDGGVKQAIHEALPDAIAALRHNPHYSEMLDTWQGWLNSGDYMTFLADNLKLQLYQLLRTEFRIIDSCIEAGMRFAKFRAGASQRDELARQMLSEGGDFLIRAVNDQMGSLFPKHSESRRVSALRSFSASLYLSATLGLAKNEADFAGYCSGKAALALYFPEGDQAATEKVIQRFVREGKEPAAGDIYGLRNLAAGSYTVENV